MSWLARLAFKRMGYPGRPETPVRIERNIGVAMADGAVLLTDRYVPQGGDDFPVVLVRSPYGRSLGLAIGMVYPLVWNGFQVVFQSCRGTGGSNGRFDPHHDERTDGLTTIAWIRQQPWSRAGIVTYGMSYLGYTQWAVARKAPDVKAMAILVSTANFAAMTYAGESLMLENAMSWTQLMSRMASEPMWRLIAGRLLGLGRIKPQQWRHLPLQTLDTEVVGKPVPFWRDWMQHDAARDPWWEPMDFHRDIADIKTPITLVAGWQDIFAPWQLRDFEALQNAGADARITVGPWRHTDRGIGREGLLEALALFRAQLYGDRSGLRNKRVRLYVQQAEQWREFEHWPPEGAQVLRWHLQPAHALATTVALASGADVLRYDPAEPTPALGGPALDAQPFSVDNRALETRVDVLCYTSVAFDTDTDIIGPVRAELYISSDVASADFFVRLCDVDAHGISRNICDGLQRVSVRSDGEPRKVLVELWPTAWRLQAGHQLRVQLSGGAFPRWARNTGACDPLATAQQLHVAQHRILHGPEYPSAVIVPTFTASETRSKQTS